MRLEATPPMEEQDTWRTLLNKVVGDPIERQHIADALKINPVTLIRWATGKSSPRSDKLRPLVEAFPQQHRTQLIELLEDEFPRFSTEDAMDSDKLEIPSEFYHRVIKAYTSSLPLLRSISISTLILQQILSHLDPHELGMSVAVTICTPPAGRQKVRSLRQILGRGTPPWGSHLENMTHFLGAESLAGYALTRGHAIVVHSREELMQMCPTYHVTEEESGIACPILLSNQTSGCLHAFSVQKDYFTSISTDLFQRYADLLVLGFEAGDFYDLSAIELGVMPPFNVQQSHIHRFQERVRQCMVQSAQQQRPITRPQAEQRVWQDLEEELLYLPYDLREM